MTLATVETKIWQALRAQVDVMGAAMNLTVSFNDDGFKPPSSGGIPEQYLICDFIPNVATRLHHANGSEYNRVGLMNISVMTPIGLHHGMDVDVQVSGTVATYFNDSISLFFDGLKTSITKDADVSQRYRDEAYWRTPVTVSWRAFG